MKVGQECARFVGNACGMSGQVLYSGGAKGVDTLSMEAALFSVWYRCWHPGRQPRKSHSQS